MSEETASEDLSSALPTARQQEPLNGGDKKTETIASDVGKKSVDFHTSNGSSSRSSSRSSSSPVGNLLNAKTDESGGQEELQKIPKEHAPQEELSSERNGENIREDKEVSSGVIKRLVVMEEEKRPQLKLLETRSQYHSIQQLSSPSIKSNESVSSSAPPHPNPPPSRISYKISDIVTPSEFYGENGKHSSFNSGNRESMENAAMQSSDDDADEIEEVQKRARKMLPNGRVMAYGWRSQHGTQKPLVHCRSQRGFSVDDDDDGADEEEEFLQAGIRCGSESFDDLSDMDMSDGGASGSHDDDGSLGEVQQREAALQNNVEDSSQGQDVADEFVLTDAAGFEGRMEAKRARVENIIKTMTPLHKGVLPSFPICRSFSAVSKLQTENRDKEFSLQSSVHHQHHHHHDHQVAELRRPKRKQYIPQQVDPRGSEQLDLLPPAAKVCITERDAVCNELLKMQEGLNEMQHKYRQMLDGDHEEVSYDLTDREGCKERSGGRSEKGHGGLQSDVNQNDVRSISREFRQAFSNGGEWMALNLANESHAKEFGHNGSITSLEQLTKILKTEITIGVERLVDNFLKTFLRKYLQNTTSRGGTAKSMEMLHKAVAPVSSRDDGEHHLRVKDEPLKMDNNHTRDKGTGQQLRGGVSGTGGSRVRDDFSGSVNHVQEDVHTDTRDNPSVGECKRKAPTPLNFTAPSYHAVVNRTGADVSSHLPTLPPPPPLTMQPPFQIHSSMSDVSRPSISCHEHSSKPAEKYREHFFDAHNGGAYGIQQSHLSLFGPPHPHLYYSPCIGKFPPPAFVKEQEQMEPLPLIVGAPKKPKRSKVIDRVSPRAVRSLPQETATQNDDGSRQIQDSSPGRSFHPGTARYHPAGPVHDAFPHPSLLPFGLAPSVALHNSSLQQHSTLLQAMYSQIPSISHREKPSSLSSPNRKTQPFSSPSDIMVSASSKSFPKCESADAAMYDQMMMSDSMMAVTGSHGFTSTLTPMHLRKAKLMFFYVRYPSSAILKVYFPDVKFNKNNTAQLVKWFSNFREFYYIQMEKYARQAIVEGVKTAKELVVSTDAELYRILVVHYNRNCQIEVPENFRYVVQSTLREFYTSIVAEKDQEPSWKKAIYKVIARMDDPVPDYFKSPNWMERLADG